MSDAKPLSWNVKLAYGVGQISEGIKTHSFNLLVLFYYSQLLELPPHLTGAALFIILLFDAVTDPLTGSLSDRWRSRWGRRHPFMYASILPLAASYYLLFMPPEGLSQTALFLWLTFWGMAVRGAITLFQVPHWALGAELTSDYTERTILVQLRQGLAFVGLLTVVSLSFLVFFAGEKGQWDAAAYPPLALTLALIMAGVMTWCAAGTHHLIPTLLRLPPRAEKMGLFSPVADWLDVLRNRSFRWYFSGVLIIFIMVGVDGALTLHVGSYIWQLERGQLFFMLMIFAIGAMVGSIFTRALHRRFDKKPLVIFGTTCWATLQLLPILLYLAGWLPPMGSNELLWILVGLRFVQGLGTVQSLVSAGSMMADLADEHELLTGNRREGVFFGALSFSAKATSGFGKMMAGIALTLIAWPVGKDILPADVPPDKITWLALIYGPIVCGFAIIAIYCFGRYDINRARHAQILEALEERRASQEQVPATDYTAAEEASPQGAAPWRQE